MDITTLCTIVFTGGKIYSSTPTNGKRSCREPGSFKQLHPFIVQNTSVVKQESNNIPSRLLIGFCASLRVLPSSTQFFQYDSVTLSCGNSSEWKVKRNTSTHVNAECFTTWGKRNGSECFIDDMYPSDNGVYWCESGAGKCSNAVNITVTAGSVILERPVLPVQEGDAVTLRCRSRTSSPGVTAEFYKNGILIGSSSTGNMSILNVSKSDEGLYKCNISGAGESPDSWLAVRAEHPASFHSSLTHILLPVVGVSLLLVLVLLLFLCCKGKMDSDVSYTDVTITQEVPPKRDGDMDATSILYSTIKPAESQQQSQC